jgi:hypothetical protein
MQPDGKREQVVIRQEGMFGSKNKQVWFSPRIHGHQLAYIVAAATSKLDPVVQSKIILHNWSSILSSSLYTQFSTFLDTRGFRAVATCPYVYRQLSSKR